MTPLPDDSTNIDAIIRAWKYYRMLTDRLETLFAKERAANTSIFPSEPIPTNMDTSKRPRLNSVEIPSHTIPITAASLLPDNQHPTTIMDHTDEPLEESHDQDNNGLSLMIENQTNNVMGFPISRPQRQDQQSNFETNDFVSIMTGNTNVNESFMNTMDPNPIMMDEDHTLHHEPIQNVQHPDEPNDDVIWVLSSLPSIISIDIRINIKCSIKYKERQTLSNLFQSMW